jgi:gliding motility-associated-like protein
MNAVSTCFHVCLIETCIMKILIRRAILLLSLASTISLVPKKALATHFAGSDLTYTCISGNQYRIDLTFYRDCAGVPAPAAVTLKFSSVSCGISFTRDLDTIANTGSEITYPCPTVITKCDDPSSSIPGIQKYVYSGIVTFPANCTDWVIDWQYCCRNCDITTIVVPSPCVSGTNQGIYISATLDNLNTICNSSPQFSNIPISFVCIGQNFTYNHGAVDPDGDSLVYTLVDPLAYTSATNTIAPVNYQPGYSATNPITSSPALSLDPLTGDIVMTPTQLEVGVMSVLVEEYRNGILIGSVLRDMEIYVQPCNNTLPTATGINGTADHDTTICPGTQLCFDVFSNDVDPNQIVSMTWNQGIPNSTFTVSGFPFPTGHFCWTPTAADISANPYTFTVTVVDNACPNNGYQAYSFQVLVNSPLVNININDISCNGGSDGSISVVPVNPGNGFSFLWAPGGDTTSSITNLGPGNYSVTVYDSTTLCTATFPATITNPSQLSGSINVLNANCSSSGNAIAIATAAGGTPAYSFSWNTIPPILNDTATGLLPGNYTVTITDDQGCTTQSSVTIAPGSGSITFSIDTVSVLQCFGDTNGIAQVTASGGIPGYTYVWNTTPVQTGPVASGLPAGSYTVTVTDSAGCTSSQNINIAGPSQIVINGFSNAASCNASDGSAWINYSGGTPGYQVQWQGQSSTSDTLFNIPAGQYTAIVTDTNGCVQQQQLLVSTLNFNPNASVVSSVSCFGGSNGSATVQPQGGTAPYTVTWNTNPVQNGNTAINLPAGTYLVTVTDSNNCTGVDTVTVTSPAAINISLTVSNSCTGDSTGSITSTVSGGTPNYQYSWSPYGGTGSAAFNLITGTYTVTVTDANNCTTTQSAQVASSTPINITVDSVSTPTCNGGFNGFINISVSGGGGQYSYSWSSGSMNEDLINADAGVHTITVTDQYGCSVQLQQLLTQPSPVPVNAGGDTAICEGNTFILDAILSQGTSGIWSAGNGITFSNDTDPNAIAMNLQSGINQLQWTVTDADGCTGTATITIFNYVNLAATAGQDTSFCGAESVQLNGNIYPGFNGMWTASTPVIFNDQFAPDAVASHFDYGNNILIWQITNGACVTSDSVAIDYSSSCDLELPTGFSPNGDGYNDGYFIRGIERYKENYFRVFNRWGNEVYFKEDYVNSDWTGQNKKGEDLPEGTYFVILEIKNSEIVKNTYVDLRRSFKN